MMFSKKGFLLGIWVLTLFVACQKEVAMDRSALKSALISNKLFKEYQVLFDSLEIGFHKNKFNIKGTDLAKVHQTKLTTFDALVNAYTTAGMTNAKEYLLLNQRTSILHNKLLKKYKLLATMPPSERFELFRECGLAKGFTASQAQEIWAARNKNKNNNH